MPEMNGQGVIQRVSWVFVTVSLLLVTSPVVTGLADDETKDGVCSGLATPCADLYQPNNRTAGIITNGTSTNCTSLHNCSDTTLFLEVCEASCTAKSAACDCVLLDSSQFYECVGSPPPSCGNWTNQANCTSIAGCTWITATEEEEEIGWEEMDDGDNEEADELLGNSTNWNNNTSNSSMTTTTNTSTGSVPLAPEYLDVACSYSSLETLPGFEMCRGACEEAECCWKIGVISCIDTEPNCLPYTTICVNLLDTNDTSSSTSDSIPPPPSNLEAICSVDSLAILAGFELCNDFCSRAECCWKVGEINCATSNPINCIPYATHCAILNTYNVATIVDEACTTDIGDLSDCFAVCADAACCFTTDIDMTCDITNPDIVCSNYGACEILNDLEGDNEDLVSPMEVEAACAINVDDLSLCVSLCASATCCYTTDLIGTCDIINPGIVCSDYQACEILYGNAEEIEDVPTPVEAACSNPEDLTLCVAICATATCCFTTDPTETCEITNPDSFCTEFQACGVLFEGYEDDGDEDEDDLLETACSTMEDLANCVLLCASATCCFTTDITKSCDITSPDIACSNYSACEVLYMASPEPDDDELLETEVPSSNVLDLVDLPTYTLQALLNASSPQSMAHDWLLGYPNLETLPQWRILQIFALATFYYALQGDEWPQDEKLGYLNYIIPECDWGDANACYFDGRYQQLHLGGISLYIEGRVPPEVAFLSSLEELTITYTTLDGDLTTTFFPTTLGTLQNLTTIKFYGNDVVGTIPNFIGKLRNLSYLTLESNQLTGTIPFLFMEGLTSLTYLSLVSNELSGPISSEIGLMASLRDIFLYDNSLSGPLPSELGSLTSLSKLSINDNAFSGKIPTEIGLLGNLWGLWLHDNQLTGTIPSTLGLLTSISNLHLHNNLLTGSLPEAICSLPSLTSVRVDCDLVECPPGCCSCS